jgi:hypothetical protein
MASKFQNGLPVDKFNVMVRVGIHPYLEVFEGRMDSVFWRMLINAAF